MTLSVSSSGFLASHYARVARVSVNTLLAVDDYAYVLANSGATAALVSGRAAPGAAGGIGEGAEPGPHALRVAADLVNSPKVHETSNRPSRPMLPSPGQRPRRRSTTLSALFLRLRLASQWAPSTRTATRGGRRSCMAS